MPAESVVNTALTGIVAIAIAIIGLVGGRKMTEKTDSPKNRADFVFNGYDRIIERLEADLKGKDKIIRDRDSYILELEAELRDRTTKS